MTTTEFNRARASLKKAVKGQAYRYDPALAVIATQHWVLRMNIFTHEQRHALHAELALAAESSHEMPLLPSIVEKWIAEERPVLLTPLPLVYHTEVLRLVPLVAPDSAPAQLRTVLVQEHYLRALETACHDITLSWWGHSKPGDRGIHAKSPDGTVQAILMPIYPYGPGPSYGKLATPYAGLKDYAESIVKGLTHLGR